MESLLLLQSLGLPLFTLADFGKLFNIENQQTLYKKIARLEEKRIIQKLQKGKYRFLFQPTSDFCVANFLYQPSYISLESALSFYGIITGFPYQITSITTNKTHVINIGQQEFRYSHISNSLYWGYEKQEDFLLAQREKALLDYIYLGTKGLRNLVFDEMDLTTLDHKKLASYAKQFDNKQITNIISTLV
jgi:predicted transcriptional regulator of viral defense system